MSAPHGVNIGFLPDMRENSGLAFPDLANRPDLFRGMVETP